MMIEVVAIAVALGGIVWGLAVGRGRSAPAPGPGGDAGGDAPPVSAPRPRPAPFTPPTFNPRPQTQPEPSLPDSLPRDALLIGGSPERQPAQELLARTIWGEARGESPNGMRAVGEVIRNRVLTAFRGKSTYSGVILDPYQFSAWLDDDPNRDKMLAVDFSDSRFERAYEIAGAVISGKTNIFDAVDWRHYYNPSVVGPDWAASALDAVNIGAHRFLKGVR